MNYSKCSVHTSLTSSLILLWLQGSTFPAMNAILAHWVPPQQRGILGSFVFAGEFWSKKTNFFLPGFVYLEKMA